MGVGTQDSNLCKSCHPKFTHFDQSFVPTFFKHKSILSDLVVLIDVTGIFRVQVGTIGNRNGQCNMLRFFIVLQRGDLSQAIMKDGVGIAKIGTDRDEALAISVHPNERKVGLGQRGQSSLGTMP